jgi:hypothetical protein
MNTKFYLFLIILLFAFQLTKAQSADAGADQLICGTETQLQGNAPPEGHSGSWTLIYGTAVIENSSVPNTQVSNLGKGDNGFRWTFTNGSHDDVIITNGLPYVEAGSNQTTCSATRSMAANTPESGETGFWEQISGDPANIISPTDYNTVIENIKNGSSTFKWTIQGADCSLSDEVSITRHEALAEAGEDVYSCHGTAEITASIPPRGTGYWTAVGSGLIEEPTSNQTMVYDLPDNQNTFRWNVEYEGCYDFDELDVFNTNLSVSTSGDKTVCSNETTISGTKPEDEATGTWELLGGSAIIENESAYITNVRELNAGANAFRWTVSKNNCEKSAELTITNDEISVINAGTDQIVCDFSGELEALAPAEDENALWEVITGTAEIADATLYNSEVSNLSRGENRFKWTVSNENCSAADEVIIENNLPNYAVLSPDEEICTDEYTLTASELYPNEFGLWTKQDGASGDILDPTNNTSDVISLGSGNNSFRWTVSNQDCQVYEEITLTNNKITTDAGEDAAICETDYFLSAQNSVAGSGYWMVENSEGTPIFDDPTQKSTFVRNLAPGNNVLKWYVSKGKCEASDIISIRNSQPDNVYAGSDAVSCSDEAWLSAAKPSSGNGLWSLESGNGSISNPSQRVTSVSNLQVGDNVFRWTVTDNNCSDYDEVIITRKHIIADAGLDDETCSTNYDALQGNIPENGLQGIWTVSGGNGAFENPTSHTTSVTALSPGDNRFTWTIYDNDCSSSDDVIITNNIPTTASVGSDKEICTYQSGISANQPSTGTGRWSLISGGGTIENISNNLTTVSEIPKGISRYKWTITKGTCSSEAIITLTNNSLTTAAGDDVSICENAYFLTAEPPLSNETGLWTLSSGSGDIADPTYHNSKVSNLYLGLNKFKWSVTKGSCTASDFFSITNDLVEANAWLSGPDSICTDMAAILGNEPIAGAEGTWEITAGGGYIEDVNDPSTHIYNLPIGTTDIRWTIDHNACSDYADISVSNNSVTASAGEDEIVCDDQAPLSGNTPQSFASGLWTRSSGSGEIANPLSPQTEVSGLAFGTNVFQWEVTGNGCSDNDKVVISRNDFSISAGLNQEICGSSTGLSGENPSPGYGIWSVSGSPGVTIENPTDYQTAVNGISNDSENIFRWTVYRNGCSAYDDVTITNTYIQAYAGADQSVCEGNAILAAQTPSAGSGIWTLSSGGGTIEAPENPNSSVSGLPLGQNVLRWTVRNKTCESYDVVIISNDRVISSAGNDRSVCSSRITLSADPPETNAYGLWEVLAGTAETETPSAYNTQVYNLQKGINTFRWTVYQGDCNSGGDEVSITNNSFEAYAGEDQELPFRIYNTTLNAELDNDASGGSWSILSGGGFFTNPTDPQTEVSGMASGENTFNWRVEKNNCFASDQVIILVKDFEAYAGEDQQICTGQTYLNARNEGGDLQIWSVMEGNGEFENPNDPKTSVSNIERGENIFRWSVTRNNYTSYDDVLITNNDFDVSAGSDVQICESEYLLNAQEPSAGDTGRWAIAGIGSGSFDNPSLHNTRVVNLQAGSNFFSWEITSNNCRSADTVEVVWNRPPVADFNPDFTTVDAPKTVNFFNQSSHQPEQTPADVFYWQTETETFATTYSPNIPTSYRFEDNAAGDSIHTIYLVAFDEETQCSDTSYNEIHVFYSTSDVEKNEAGQILIYPNPSKTHIFIRFPQKSDYLVRIYSLEGKMVLREEFRQTRQARIKVSELPAGLYKSVITQGTNKYTGSILIQK